jgi:hypothetical protein
MPVIFGPAVGQLTTGDRPGEMVLPVEIFGPLPRPESDPSILAIEHMFDYTDTLRQMSTPLTKFLLASTNTKAYELSDSR